MSKSFCEVWKTKANRSLSSPLAGVSLFNSPWLFGLQPHHQSCSHPNIYIYISKLIYNIFKLSCSLEWLTFCSVLPLWERSVLHCPLLHCTAHYCTAQHCTALHYTELHSTTLHCIALHCTKMYCIALHYTALQYTALHYNATRFPFMKNYESFIFL